MTGQLDWEHPGAAVTVQDQGRFGHRATGVPLAGAADAWLMACAQALVGNPPDHAALEVGLMGPTLRARAAPVRLALAGDFTPQLLRSDGSQQALQAWRSLIVQPGDALVVGACRSGIGYLALAGGVQVPPVLGSRSTYARAGLGGMEGRLPRTGDSLLCGAGHGPLLQAPQAWQHEAGPLRVLPGPQQDHFTDAAWQTFFAGEYSVTQDADRMGLRLQGPALQHHVERGADIVSEAVVPGTIQVPGTGQPIILGVDAQTIGGYAKIATVISADLPRLAHLRPGSRVRFALVKPEEAVAAYLVLRARLTQWVSGLRPALAQGLPDERALQTHNLISGAVNAFDPYNADGWCSLP